jgi:hypothetical protein
MNPGSWIRLGIVALVGIVLQVGVLNDIVVLGAHADLMVVIAAAGGIAGGPGRGAIIGFVAGCFSDLSVSLPFGFGPLAFVIVGFGSSYLLRAANGRDLPLAEVATVVGASVAGTFLYAFFAAAVGQPGMLGPNFVRVVADVAVGAGVMGLPALWVMRWVTGPSALVVGGIGGG